MAGTCRATATGEKSAILLKRRLMEIFSSAASLSRLVTRAVTPGWIAAMRLSKLSMSNSRNLRSSTLAFSTPALLPERSERTPITNGNSISRSAWSGSS